MSEEKRMKKGKLIQKYIGEGIAPFGFVYQGRKGDNWVFERELEDTTQEILLYEYRFQKNMISFDIFPGVRGKGIARADDFEGIKFNSNMLGFWKYDDEESFIEVLNLIKDILINQGMKKLEKLSVPNKISTTNEMHHELYFHHEELADKFQQENQIEVTGYDEENIDRWFKVIEERVRELQKGEYEDAKAELVEIAAFLGEQLVRYKGGEWYRCTKKNYECCLVHKIQTRKTPSMNVLHLLVGGYGYNGMEWVKADFIEFLE